ncbi:transglycosylase SLT domain-containing protein [Rhizobacter sp. OV335]|uniref:transglycosylase SLT domain-containing protein n=1 Tax=Rhizobacter sp. OV335 TaxID=1500264 RepID=UPI00091382E2|nr:transglycosylase SLT domain-containing protein [Rhizobacter sp. OV335]SHM85772.1 membrane-bound lytic murein transglycosylase D [Rhizobacter sp. OV335]
MTDLSLTPPLILRRGCGLGLFAVLALLAACATTTTTGGGVEGAASAASAPEVSAAASAPASAASGVDGSTVAEGPAVAPPIDPLRPEEKVDLDAPTATIDLWARLRHGYAMPDLDTDQVRTAERWYASRPDYVQRMTERGSRYLFHIVEEVERRGMPTELALLPFVESAFNPQAVSSAKASGMWQFMPATGSTFSLKQNVFRDDRRSVLDSTRAALDYLARLHDMFGDWHLALAAYNWGEGNVQRAIARNRRAGKPTDYLSLKMPNETAYYVPKLQAVKNIVLHPETYLLALPSLDNHPYFLSVPIERDIDVALAVRLAGVSHDEFQTLNPQMNRPVILAAGTPQLLLPYDNAAQFVRSIGEHRGPLATWTAWVAPRTLRPADAAKQVGMTEEQLREVNNIPPRMLVRAGSTLLVPRAESRQTDVSEHLADNAMMSLVSESPALRRMALKAGKRESVATVAQRYRVSAAQVALWNKTTVGANFKPGQTVYVFVASKATARKPVRTASKAHRPAAKRTTRVAKR